jgi:alcohol dehydrogenase
MILFDFLCPTRIIFGPGTLAELGRIASELGGSRILVVSDPGIIAAGHTPRGLELLRAAGLTVELFDGVEENPTTKHVDAGLTVAREFRPDVIVGLGGGSSMDCAKGINFLYSCGGQMQDYWGEGKATGPMLPMIAVPTTAGTGSETQSYALISDAETHVKMACGDKRAAFRAAILDPDLTETQPARVTALTGIDALSHAIETYVTTRRNTLSLVFSREAWRRLAPNFHRVLAERPQGRLMEDVPKEQPRGRTGEREYTPQSRTPQARAQMQLGACFAGLAIENSMLGAAHALANPLTSSFQIAHGQAVALMLPHVIRYNDRTVADKYRELVEIAIQNDVPLDIDNATESLAGYIGQVAQDAGLAGRLSDCGVSKEHLPDLAVAASKQWTAKFNPVEVTIKDCQRLYETAL